MKRFLKRSAMVIGVLSLLLAFAVPSAEAGRRHRYRAAVHGPGYSATYRVHHRHYPHRGAYRVHVRAAPVVIVPTVRIAPIPYHGYYRGPSVYFYGW